MACSKCNIRHIFYVSDGIINNNTIQTVLTAYFGFLWSFIRLFLLFKAKGFNNIPEFSLEFTVYGAVATDEVVVDDTPVFSSDVCKGLDGGDGESKDIIDVSPPL